MVDPVTAMPSMPRTCRPLLLAAATTAVTVLALAAVLLLANFGLDTASLVLLLLVPLTAGLPTTLTVLGCISLWPGPPLWPLVILALAGSLCLQWATYAALARRRQLPA